VRHLDLSRKRVKSARIATHLLDRIELLQVYGFQSSDIIIELALYTRLQTHADGEMDHCTARNQATVAARTTTSSCTSLCSFSARAWRSFASSAASLDASTSLAFACASA
jgi:hypothetical protein